MNIDEYIDSALRRLETDLKVARENWYVNPFLAQVALLDLSKGANYTESYLINDADANQIASELPEPNVDEVMTALNQVYKDSGIDLSHFQPVVEDEPLPNPYEGDLVSGLPRGAREFIEKVLEAIGDDPRVEAYVVTDNASTKIK